MREQIGGFRRKRVLIVGGILLATAVAASGFFGYQEYRMRQLKATVGAHLLDPYSAQYRDIREKDGAICGEVNAKNRMGAYTGYTLFVYVNGEVHFEDVTDIDSSDSQTKLKALKEHISFLRLALDNCPDEDPTLDQSQAASGAQRQLSKP